MLRWYETWMCHTYVYQVDDGKDMDIHCHGKTRGKRRLLLTTIGPAQFHFESCFSRSFDDHGQRTFSEVGGVVGWK